MRSRSRRRAALRATGAASCLSPFTRTGTGQGLHKQPAPREDSWCSQRPRSYRIGSLFISHSSRDSGLARILRDALREHGFRSVFLDIDPETGLTAGSRWEDEIYARLRSADAVIFVSTEASAVSQWCFAELAMARSMGKAVVPLVLDGSPVPALLHDTQRAEWTVDGAAGLSALWEALNRHGVDPLNSFVLDPSLPPYPGLEAFSEEQAAVFFGRDAEIRQLLARLEGPVPDRSARLNVVAGPSGSGKSSIVRSGLIPRLSRPGKPWIVIPTLVPTDAPVEMLSRRLASALARAGRSVEWRQLRSLLGESPRGLVEIARDIGDATGRNEARVLLVVDQAEELLTRATESERHEFLRLLITALSVATPLRVVLTLRSEFLTPLVQEPGVADALREPYVVGPLAPERIAEVIRAPARVAGLEFDDDLVEQMVEDTGSGEALPLLAFTLRQLYDNAQRRGTARVTLPDYEVIGGVVGALTQTADAVADEVKRGAHGDVVVETLLKLVAVHPVEGASKRPVRRSSLTAVENEVVEEFITARLLSSRHDGGEATVEVTHEALLKEWTPLRKAIEAVRLERNVDPVEVRALQWERGQRDRSFLLRGTDLHEAERRLTDVVGDSSLSTRARGYVLASRRAETRRRGVIVVVILIALLVSIGLGVVALVQRNQLRELRQQEASPSTTGPQTLSNRFLSRAPSRAPGAELLQQPGM